MCVRLDGRHVALYVDGSILCFGGRHLPYGVLAIVLTEIFVAGLPLLLLWQSFHLSPMFKGFMDEATFIYKDRCRWWCSVNLLRRFVFAVLAASPLSSYLKEVWMVISAIFLLVLQSWLR